MSGHLWQSTVFALAAALLARWLRGNRAQVRFWVWLSASLKFLFPFTLLIGLGVRMGWPPVPHVIATPDVAFVVERIAEPFTVLPAPQAHTDWWRIALISVWACGFLGVSAMRFRGWIRVRSAMRESVAIGSASGVEIRTAFGLLEPGVVGIARPVVLLPEGIAESLTPAQLESVIAHELCHIRRRDNLFAAVHMLVEAAFWFHPVVWWIGARLIEERESACDEAVISLGNQPRIYADAIVGVCRLYLESPVACVSGVTGADLTRRIEAIMTNRIGLGLNRAKKFLLAGAAVAAIAVPLATGLLLSVGRLPVIHAQPPAPGAQIAPQVSSPAMPKTASPKSAPKGRGLIAMLFDFASMTAEEQTIARQNAVEYVNASLNSGDSVAIVSADKGKVTIAQDFTADPVVLAAAILRLPAGGAGAPAIESLANLLAALPDKKSLMYYSAVGVSPGDPQLQSAIDAAKRANVAIFPIDVKNRQTAAVNPYVIGVADVLEIRISNSPDSPRFFDVASNGTIAIPGIGQIRADGLTKDELGRAIREKLDADVSVQVARVNSKKLNDDGSDNPTRRRLVLRYGQPDTIDTGVDRQIWRYSSLPALSGKAEFELTPANAPNRIRINWPPPTATYTSAHASIQTYPSSAWQVLSISTESLSGHVEVFGQIQLRSSGEKKAVFRDDKGAPDGWQGQFILPAGSYVCALTASERDTKRAFSDTIEFEVR